MLTSVTDDTNRKKALSIRVTSVSWLNFILTVTFLSLQEYSIMICRFKYTVSVLFRQEHCFNPVLLVSAEVVWSTSEGKRSVADSNRRQNLSVNNRQYDEEDPIQEIFEPERLILGL
ncbi:Cysteine--tRNA ligase [Trichinella spiralis]|uniref:Cysteine--tRNA ligase n=1 Tax=Trichinella spiralis TaxID=6334 RepID=A0ABR3K592_TRISP